MNGNGIEGTSAKKTKKRKTARTRTLRPLMETAKVGTLVLLKQTAGRGPKNLQRPGRKVASSRKTEGREVEEKEEKGKEEKCEVQKEDLVEKVQRKDGKIPFSREQRRRGREERLEE